MKESHSRFTATFRLRFAIGLSLLLAGALVAPAALTFTAGTTNGLSGAQVLVPVRVTQFTGITSLQFSMHWNSAVANYVGVEQYGLPGFAAGSFGTTSAGSGTLTVSWDDPDVTGKSVPDGTAIFFIRMVLAGAPGSTSGVTIDGTPTALEAANDKLKTIPVSTANGQVSIDLVNVVPSITTQPQGQTVVVGNNVNFSVTANGTPPLTYQWRRNAAALAGGTAATLALTNVQTAQAGDYTVVVSNMAGSITSQVARLIVNIPIDTVPPTILISSPTSNPTLSVTNSPITIGGTASDNLGVTQVTWTNERGGNGTANGTVNWSAGGIVLLPGPNTITVSARDAENNVGMDGLVVTYTPPVAGPLALVVGVTNGVSGADVLVPVRANQFIAISSFQFSFHWNPAVATYVGVEQFGVPGLASGSFGGTLTNSGTLTVSWDDPDGFNKTVSDGTALFFVRLRLVGVGGAVTGVSIDGNPTALEASNAELLPIPVTVVAGLVTVFQSPSITTQPQGQTVILGSNVTLNVVATGTPSPTYQWRLNSANLSGATASTLALTNVQQAQNGGYTVVVSNPVGAVTSVVAQLVVTLPPNTPPTISPIANRNTPEDLATPAIAFTVNDQQTPPGNLTLMALSLNSLLIPPTNIVFGGSGSNRTVTLTPAGNQFGSATIMIIVSDGQASATNSFALTVTPVNDPPTISNIPDKLINKNQPCPDLPFIVGDAETSAGALTVSAASSNPALVPSASLILGGSGANRTVRFLPATNQTGAAIITITVSDGVLNSNDTFLVVVQEPLNVPNLVSCWRFDEGSGPMAFDALGNNNGSLANDPGRTSGRIGAAVSFDGVNDYVNVPDSNSLDFSNHLTLALWFRPSQLLNASTGRKDLLEKFLSYGLILGYPNSDGRLAFVLNAGNTLVKGTTSSWQANQWYHVVATYDGLQLKLYVNGTLDATSPASELIGNTTAPLQIGGNTDVNLYFPGGLDDVRLYGASLSPSEVAALYLETSGQLNSPPILPPIPDKIVNEGSSVIYTNLATDLDVPAQTLTYTFQAGAPAGATLNSSSGVFAWTPGEAQGPSVNTIGVVVRDNGVPSLTTTQRFTITVLEVNSPPHVTSLSNYAAQVLIPLRVTNTVSDADMPTNQVTFELTEGPKGVRINKFTGIVSWTPTRDQAPSTNFITVVATDNGTPPLSSINRFSVNVGDFLEIGMGSAVLRAGQSGGVPINMLTSAEVSSIRTLLFAPEDRLSNLSISTLAPELQPALLQVQGPGVRQLNFDTISGQTLRNGRLLAQLNFTAISTQSAFVPLNFSNVTAFRANGLPLPTTFGNAGRVVVVGAEPLLEALFVTNLQPVLVLYGEPGTNYVVESKREFGNTNQWLTAWQGPLTNLSQRITLSATTNRHTFFRAIRPR